VNNTMYVIMGVVLLWYTVVLIVGLLVAVRDAKREAQLYKLVLGNVLKELKDIIIKEEQCMLEDKGANKNRRDSEPINFQPKPLSPDMGKEVLTFGDRPNLTLSDLLTVEPTDKDYEEVLGLLIKLVRQTFKDYKFLIAKSQDETKDANFLQLVSHYSEDPYLHKEVFQKCIHTNIDMPTLRQLFAEKAAEGKVLDLGEGVTIIVEDGTGNPPTGVSNINSGLEGGEIAFIFSFIKTDNLEEWKKNNLPQEEEAADE
jgi:hypothetical protein